MRLIDKNTSRSEKALGGDLSAYKMANEYIAAYGNVSIERYNEMSEKLIELAIWYWEKGDLTIIKH